jgi:hypothetical protein
MNIIDTLNDEILNIMPMFYFHVGVVGEACKNKHFFFPSINLSGLKLELYCPVDVSFSGTKLNHVLIY